MKAGEAKISDETVDEVTEALKAFFDRKGGYQTVAHEISVNPQSLYYIVSGRNAPTLKTVMRILRHYPTEVTLRKALSLPLPSQSGENPSPEDGINWKDRFFEVQERYDSLEAKFNLVAEQVKHLTKHNQLMEFMYQKLDPSFVSASSQSTASAEFTQLWAEYRKSAEVEGLVRYPEKEQTEEVSVLPLNPQTAPTILRSLWPSAPLEIFA